MNRNYNYLLVNYPKIQLLPSDINQSVPYGQFVETPVEESDRMDNKVMEGQSFDMYLPNFSLRTFEGAFNHDIAFSDVNGTGTELLGSCIFFDATMTSILKGKYEGVECFPRTHNFKFDPNIEYRHCVPARTHLHFLHLSYSPAYLAQLLPGNETWSDELKSRILKRERILGDKVKPITMLQDVAIKTILDCPLRGELGLKMIETSIIQLILIQLDLIFNRDWRERSVGVSKSDQDIAHDVKEFLTLNYLDDHSLQSLSKYFGTNTNKLMSVFKNVFGKSIFEYITDQRMQYAQQLLKEDSCRIIDVAHSIGYKNANHFSTAYKRKFGVIPKEDRRRFAA